MRTLLILILLLLLPGLSGCETAWGGSPQSSINKLNAKQNASVDALEQSGQISSSEADAMRKSNDTRASETEREVNQTIQGSASPAGESGNYN